MLFKLDLKVLSLIFAVVTEIMAPRAEVPVRRNH